MRKARVRIKLRESASSDGVRIGTAEVGDLMSPTGESSEDGLWIKVDLISESGDRVRGWVQLADTRKTTVVPPPIGVAVFVETCIDAERTFNSREKDNPWPPLADFVIARAIIETGIVNTTTLLDGTDVVGPLQMSSAEWDRFLQERPADPPFFPFDRTEPLMQVWGATYSMHRDAEAISKLQAQRGVGTNEDPFIPSYLDLFHAELASCVTVANNAKFALLILDASQSDTDKNLPIAELLKLGLKSKDGSPIDPALSSPIPTAEVEALFAARGDVPNPPTITVAELVARTEKKLDDALAKAHELIKTHCPEELQVITAVTGQAPWMTVAEQAKAAGVDANKPEFKNTILDYFNATDHGRPNNIVAWCGAFAAHCMKNSGSPVAAASIPKGSAAAASWKIWGAKLPLDGSIPTGAVVVLSPTPNSGRTGHVGFFVGFSPDGKKVNLLGGNQSNKVTITGFPKDRIAAIRWLDLPAAVTPTPSFTLPTSIKPEHRGNATKIVNAFGAAGYKRHHQIAALANAIAESHLDHNAHAMPEDSVGLFQLRRRLGVGGNHSVAALKDPDFNIKLIIAEAKKVAAFANAMTLADAVSVFVRRIERPANAEAAIQKRVKIANKLIA
jgi:uncharacterized protein (TIGR02594 family)